MMTTPLEDITSKKFYIQVTDLSTGKRYEDRLSVQDLLSDKEKAVIQEQNIASIEEYDRYLAKTVDYCKLYAFDPEVDSYDDFSEDAIRRIELFNLKNSVAFNRSITNLRKAGIHLPDGRDRQYGWPDYEKLRMLIESGGDQKEILRLFPIVFAEYVVMPGDVDLNDSETHRYTTIGGRFPYVYLDNMLPESEYSVDNPWSIGSPESL